MPHCYNFLFFLKLGGATLRHIKLRHYGITAYGLITALRHYGIYGLRFLITVFTSRAVTVNGISTATIREPVDPLVRDFWNDLYKAQIILKLPDYVDKTIYTLEPYSKYMRVDKNEIVLDEHMMLNSHNELIFDNGEVVTEGITMNFVENKSDGTEELRPPVKFLRLCKSPLGVVYGVSTRNILIKKS